MKIPCSTCGHSDGRSDGYALDRHLEKHGSVGGVLSDGICVMCHAVDGG